jgi:sporulation protein YlmC with PRC-barrel domain
MLHRVKTLKGYKLDSLDGEMGKVKDFYFDDQHWTVRYLVADTGNWLTGRQVLISPYALVAAIKEENHIAVDLTRKQIEDSPSLASDKPVSRQFEEAYYAHYGWPSYWVGPYPWGRAAYPAGVGGPPAQPSQPEKKWDPHLRSTGALIGYHIQAADGEIGHVEDFVIDDETWTIRYLIVDTRNWWPGKMVLVSPRWIERVGWNESKVFITLPRETIKQSPEYSEESLITRDYETALHQHYDLEGYWVGGESDSPRNAP